MRRGVQNESEQNANCDPGGRKKCNRKNASVGRLLRAGGMCGNATVTNCHQNGAKLISSYLSLVVRWIADFIEDMQTVDEGGKSNHWPFHGANTESGNSAKLLAKS